MLAYFIRHAQSENNARADSDRVADPALTQLGEEQANKLGKWIPNLGLTKLISSPFLRTLQTAQQVHLATGLNAEVRPDWHEAGGCFSDYRPGRMKGEPGMNRSDIEGRFSGFHVADGIDEQGWYKRPDRETYAEARVRAARLIVEAQQEFGKTDDRIGFVIHCDLKRFLLESFCDDWIDIPMNTSITTVEFTPDDVRLIEFNQVDHLEPELHTF
jgi:broad specificity phosphatase PhoE